MEKNILKETEAYLIDLINDEIRPHIKMVDQGIGSYEFWGARGVDINWQPEIQVSEVEVECVDLECVPIFLDGKVSFGEEPEEYVKYRATLIRFENEKSCKATFAIEQD